MVARTKCKAKNRDFDIIGFRKQFKESGDKFDYDIKECYRSLGRIEASLEADDRLTEELKLLLKENESEHKKDLKEWRIRKVK